VVSRRLVLLGLSLLFVAFAVYGSLVPLNFRRIPIAEAIEQFKATPFVPLSRASRTDLVTNVLLFVPIGFFLLGAVTPRARLGALLAVPVVGIALAISLAIEFGQIFVHGRTPSWNDVAAETAGAVIGVVLWMACGRAATDWLSVAFHHEGEGAYERAFRLLGAYVAVWAILAALPLDFTLRPQELAGKFRAGRIGLQPFADFTLRDVGGTFLMAVPLGAFGVLWATLRKWPRPPLVGLVFGTALVLAGEIVQFLSMSRTADITDLMMGLAGTIVGVMSARQWLGSGDALGGGRVRLWPIVALMGWVLALVVRHWSPFEFNADGAFVRSRIPMFLQVPFSGYYWGLAPAVLVDASTKLLMGIPVGAMLQLVWCPDNRWLSRLTGLAAIAISGAIFLAIELGQLLLPSRYPDQTDIYIGTLGAAAGVFLVRLLRRSPTAPRSAASPPRFRADNSPGSER
jgi:glycopeptide antibiotics resistance protein